MPNFWLSGSFILEEVSGFFIPEVFLLQKVHIRIYGWENIILVFEHRKRNFSDHDKPDKLARNSFFSVKI
jgi:hypothetical protein